MAPANSFDPTGYSFASLVISVILTLIVGFFLVTSKPHRSTIGYSAFLAGIVAIIANVISLSSSSILYMGSILSALYSSFTHLTILYAFDRLSKSDVNNRKSQGIVRAGYFWILVTVVTGLSLTVVLGKSSKSHEFDLPQSDLPQEASNLSVFFLFSSWIFLIIIWALFGMLYHKLSKYTRLSMVGFATLITIEAIFTLIFKFLFIKGVPGLVVIFIFIKLPIIAAIMVAAGYSSYWIKDSENGARIESSYHNDEESLTTL